MTRLLYTTGDGVFRETEYVLAPLQNNEIRVQAVMTGVCRSDVAMMNGDFGPLPLGMQGHEGLAKVIELGSGVEDVQIGDFVATRGEPAYADEYNVRPSEYVVVPGKDPRWILEPIACGINCVLQAKPAIDLLSANATTPLPRAVIVGSGFLAKIVLRTFAILYPQISVDVVGRSNEQYFGDQGSPLLTDFDGKYDIVVDLKEDDRVFNTDCINENALVIMATEKPNGVDTTFSHFLWKAVTMVFPSPRAPTFYEAMQLARDWQIHGFLDIQGFWTRGYNRNLEWQQAFEDANNRTGDYGRGYIYWD